ncbi:MAG: hypothetical protein M0Q21_05280 [Ignavibacteriaceae bacterium]|nr:hypothetical protein [Ignavibacteriaceae bacterium]
MKEKIFSNKFLVLTGLILLAAISRLIPHPLNFAPITGMALFASVYFDEKKFAFAVPVLAMFLSDLIIGLHSQMVTVYLSFVLIVGIGFLIKNKKSVGTVALASVVSSILFFVVTNFGMWALGTLYTKDITGLLLCFTAAIPFFQNTVLGDLFYTGLLFGVYELVKVKLPQTVKVQ